MRGDVRSQVFGELQPDFKAGGVVNKKSILATLATAALLLGTVTLGPAYARPSYPSWSEVQAAKKKVADKKALIKKLQDYITQLEDDVAALGKVALIKGEAFNQAETAVEQVKAKVTSLETQVDRAATDAQNAQDELGQLAAQMYRDGAAGTTVNFLLNADEADNMLYQLGVQDKLAQQTDTIYSRAVAKKLLAQSLQDQLSEAKKDLDAKAKVAQAAFDEAQAAADAVQAKLDENKALNSTFYAQLASLQNTTADLERRRAEGLAWEARQNQGSSGGVPDAPSLYDVGDPSSVKVEGAIAFAKRQLGEDYVLGGMGPNVWDCSGITKASYAAVGIYIGTHSATNQFMTLANNRRLVPIKDAVKGDIMWYSIYSGFTAEKYHVVIYLGGGMMLEAPRPGAFVRIVPLRYGELFPYAGRPSGN